MANFQSLLKESDNALIQRYVILSCLVPQALMQIIWDTQIGLLHPSIPSSPRALARAALAFRIIWRSFLP